jgi:LysR family transcriptional regulator (chromosome initiation inhibitor)
MPVVAFNAKDTLQHDLLAEVGVVTGREPPTHRVPTSTDFLEAVTLSLGWGMVPETQLLPLEAAGRLVRLRPDRPVDVPLHWQRWRVDSLLLGRVTEVVRRAASTHLRR